MRIANRCGCAIWALAFVLTGCAWQDTVHEVVQLPKYLGLQQQMKVVHEPRWSLPVGTPVRVHAPADVPQAWTRAAERGLSRTFSVAEQAEFSFTVAWPPHPVVSTPDSASGPDNNRTDEKNSAADKNKKGVVGRMVDSLDLRPLAQREQLWVRVRSGDGFYQEQLALHINPKLWGKDWHDAEIIEAGFAHLAETLSGR